MFFSFKKKVKTESEKRKESRADFHQLSYFIQVNDFNESGVFDCRFHDISESGVALETNRREMKEGDEIRVLYKIGTMLRKDNLKIQNASYNTRTSRYGCAFIDHDETRRSIINDYIINTPRKNSAEYSSAL